MSILMYDTASSAFQGGVPNNAEAVLAYWDMRFRNLGAAQARFPKLHEAGRIVALTCGADPRANGIDWEPGNVCPAIGPYIAEAEANKVWRPVVYADISDMKHLIPEMANVIGPLSNPGPGRRVRILTAHPTGVEHICGPNTCGQLPWEADGTQYWWSSLHGNKVDYDISAVRTDFFPGLTQPAAKPDPRHYERYDDAKRVVAGNTSERELVVRYDVLRAQQTRLRHPSKPELGLIRAHLQQHVDRLLALVVAAPDSKAALSAEWREYRLDRMLRRINGELVRD